MAPVLAAFAAQARRSAEMRLTGAAAKGLFRAFLGAVAQLVERLVRNEEVSGSIPLGSTRDLPTACLTPAATLRGARPPALARRPFLRIGAAATSSPR